MPTGCGFIRPFSPITRPGSLRSHLLLLRRLQVRVSLYEAGVYRFVPRLPRQRHLVGDHFLRSGTHRLALLGCCSRSLTPPITRHPQDTLTRFDLLVSLGSR